MARDLKPKCKYCRREGIKLFLKGERCYSTKCAIVKRNFPPGMHGPKNNRRLTSFGTQLREKQKLKRTYGILEKQLRLYFDRSIKHSGDTSENLLRQLETRLDNVVFRLGFTTSRAHARQLVNHGHFQVNDRKASIPSHQVKDGDVISLKKGSYDSPQFVDISKKLEKAETPEWLLADPTKISGKAIAMPDKGSMKYPFDLQIIVEFYSR